MSSSERLSCLGEKKSLVKRPCEMLLGKIWNLEYDGENRTVDVHVRNLRQKLGDKCDIIRTVRGLGYKAEEA